MSQYNDHESIKAAGSRAGPIAGAWTGALEAPGTTDSHAPSGLSYALIAPNSYAPRPVLCPQCSSWHALCPQCSSRSTPVHCVGLGPAHLKAPRVHLSRTSTGPCHSTTLMSRCTCHSTALPFLHPLAATHRLFAFSKTHPGYIHSTQLQHIDNRASTHRGD